MHEWKDKVLSKKDKRMSLSDTAYMKDNLPEVFDPRRFGSVKAAQIAAYDFMKGRVQKDLKLRRVRQLWEGKATRVDGEEKDALREARIVQARKDYAALRCRIERLETIIAEADEDSSRQSLAGSGQPSCELGRRYRPGIGGGE